MSGNVRLLIRNLRKMRENGTAKQCRGCGQHYLTFNAEQHRQCKAEEAPKAIP